VEALDQTEKNEERSNQGLSRNLDPWKPFAGQETLTNFAAFSQKTFTRTFLSGTTRETTRQGGEC
jgi:hypothetical protein